MRIFLSTLAGFVIASAALAAEPRRELGSHQHGHGRLNIAVENGRVSMDLDVPGADILGFEHKPNTPDQKAAFEAAKAKLADALSLFRIPAAAGCNVKEAKVSLEAEHDEMKPEAGVTAHAGDEHHHSDFNVDYSLECQSPAGFTRIDFDYFKAFAGAQVLDVTVITPKGQNSYVITREKPVLDLSGVI